MQTVHRALLAAAMLALAASAPAIADMLGGQVPITVDGLPASLPHVQAGKLRAMGYRPIANTPEQFDTFIRAEIAKWAKVIKKAGITVD